MFKPFEHQLSGADFLARNDRALLADQPRVGKTGTTIIAMDMNLEQRVLIVTTASGRAVWKKAFSDWSRFNRNVHVIENSKQVIPWNYGVVIVSWGALTTSAVMASLISKKWDRLVLDESHFAKSVEAKRTRAVYGDFRLDGHIVDDSASLLRAADGKVWCLTGTPLPNSPADLYPMLRCLRPEAMKASGDLPDVTKYGAFLHRYCVVKMKKISNFRKIPVVIGGRNLEELKGRMAGLMLRRTQQDVGIRPPFYDIMPLMVSANIRKLANGDLDKKAIIAAAEAGNTRELELQLGPLRRLTGELKADAVAGAVAEELDNGLDKIVLAYWHIDVGASIGAALADYGVVGINGSTPDKVRSGAVEEFSKPDGPRVFLAQIQAAGEAIDLSASATLWFVETSLAPKDMKQMSLRITNHTQTRQALVRVCVLEGSIDEALQSIILRKMDAIREVQD